MTEPRPWALLLLAACAPLSNAPPAPPAPLVEETGVWTTQRADLTWFGVGMRSFGGRASDRRLAVLSRDGLDGRVHLLDPGASPGSLPLTDELALPTPETRTPTWELAGGDLDGDGRAELAVSVHAEGAREPAAVLLFDGAGTGEATRLEAPLSDASWGAALAIADLTGDGVAELIIGAPGADAADNRSGAVLLHEGGSAADPVTLQTTSLGPFGRLHDFGAALAVGGDTDGDGVAELAVAGLENGVVHVYRGQAGDVVDPGSEHAVRRSAGAGSPWRMGMELRFPGDINGDGYEELVTASSADEHHSGAEGAYTGQVRVFYGTAAGADSDTEQQLYPDTPDTLWRFGQGVDGGDLDGDGLADLVVTGLADDPQTGLAWLFMGRPEGITAADATPLAVPEASESPGLFPTVLDLDGDGGLDLLMGLDWDPGGQRRGGIRYWITSSGQGQTGRRQ